jgi:hypothetical protein
VAQRPCHEPLENERKWFGFGDERCGSSKPHAAVKLFFRVLPSQSWSTIPTRYSKAMGSALDGGVGPPSVVGQARLGDSNYRVAEGLSRNDVTVVQSTESRE